jgi:hypothetical protein
MDAAALVLWVLTALGGATMAAIWLAGRGPAQHRAGVSRISPGRLGTHFLLAAAGLALWIVHVVSDSDGPGWVALAVLPVVAGLGFLMFMTWLAGRGSVTTAPDRPAEQRFPVVVVAAHGLFAVLTLLAAAVALLS